MEEEKNHVELNLRSEEVQEILTNPPSWLVRWGITIVFALTGIILALSFLIKYPDYVSAKVIVTTKTPTEHVVARYSGALEDIYIENGDTVVSGQRLAVFRNASNVRDVYQLKFILDTIQSSTPNLQFPITLVSGFVLGDIEPSYINFEKNYVDYQLLKDLDPYMTRLSGNMESLEEIKLRLQSQIRQKKVLEQEYELQKRDYERYEQLHKSGVVSQQEFESKKMEFLQMEKNLSNMAISISQMREAVASADQTLRTTKINKEEDQTRLLVNLSQSFNTLKKAVREWEYQYVLLSSIDGVVGFQEFWGENQFINAGEMVFSILPTNTSQLVGKLVLPSQNAGKVVAGQKVLVKLDNFQYQQYGMLVGKVENISVSPDNEGNYFVYISLPQGTVTSYNKKLPFEQELLGNAEIITENLSVAERIFYKFKDLFKY
ncbi:HlyD family secretion protein [Flagellimonas aequoris]|uniref:HlyD family efflux transporter periplasmic adaptor subunit n=1 Tax=Flagellimonas aequoris TaxID=2306997 RepID=A0A418N3B9_9FLAO|nr:HlyD family efflux transporter periplasmic adaptor subunit [Allomuricauda aequoris]RIV68279.1 HlyD family efflux transporter periplasmic adaptor subunit [Allomuricauda aequoris]TXJ99969.1 HlyD family efflux transporter periplasmic adaptor subunit [Allomuricauda aequoris]